MIVDGRDIYRTTLNQVNKLRVMAKGSSVLVFRVIANNSRVIPIL